MTGWKDTTVGDEIELIYGKGLPAHEREDGPFPVFGSNGCVGRHSASLVGGPGIIVGRKGSVGEVVFTNDDFWPIDTTYYVANKGGHNWRFLYYLLSSLGLTNLNSHSAVPGLNREDVYSINISLPDIHEQALIGHALDTIRDSLALEAQSVAAAQDLKLAAMRMLFTQGLRGGAQKETEIGPVPERWDVVPLGSLGRIGNGSTPKKTILEYWNGGTYPWLTSAKVYDREIVSADHFVTETALQECHLPKIQPGAILIAITGQGKTLGHCAVLRMHATINQHIAYVATDTRKADPSFVRGYLETQYDYLRQVGSGGGSTKAALTCAFLREMPIPLPPKLDEQHEIVAILDAIDCKIDLHKKKRAVLDELFKSLLYKLMAGDIRVGDLDFSVLTSSPREAAA